MTTLNRSYYEENEVPEMERWLLERDAEKSITGRQLLTLVRTHSKFFYTTETVWDTPDNA